MIRNPFHPPFAALLPALAAACLAGAAFAQEAAPATTATPEAEPSAEVPGAPASLIASVTDAEGAPRGSVVAAPTASGVMLLTITLEGLPPGIHGAHVHETGTCTHPDFKSAGGHIAGEHDHGVMAEGGAHPGDLPNLHLTEAGSIEIELFAPGLTPEMLTDADGAAFVLHAGPDDYIGQPAGNSGDRIACGAFAPAS